MAARSPSVQGERAGRARRPHAEGAIDRTTGTAERKRAEAVARFPGVHARRATRARASGTTCWPTSTITWSSSSATRPRPGARCTGRRPPTRPAGSSSTSAATAGRAGHPAKSMLGEEIGLHARAGRGRHRAGRDRLGRAHHPARRRPALHIIWPAMHRTREQVAADCSRRATRQPHASRGRAEPTWSRARGASCGQVPLAEVGISGANFLVADTGAAAPSPTRATPS